MKLLIAGYLFFIGLCMGSFALALVDRMRAKKDWVRGRSECDHCKHVLGFKDLVPLLSWLSAGGKCRYCKKKLSASYPLAELSLGIIFVVSFWFFPFSLDGIGATLLVLWLLSSTLCTALFIFDVRWFLLPTKIIYTLDVLALIHRIIFIFFIYDGSLTRAGMSLVGSVLVAFGLFYVLHLVSKGKWIGDGDVRFGVAMGLLLSGPLEAWLALFVASLAGIVWSLPTITSKKALKKKIPFGPFLIVGLIVAYLFGSSIIGWYTQRFLFV